jgi:hypothetical protein
MNTATRQYVVDLAVFLRSRGMTMSAVELAEHLNRNHLPTGLGHPFAGTRGTFGMFKHLYDSLTAQGRHAEADAVAEAFTREDGSYAYSTAA